MVSLPFQALRENVPGAGEDVNRKPHFLTALVSLLALHVLAGARVGGALVLAFRFKRE